MATETKTKPKTFTQAIGDATFLLQAQKDKVLCLYDEYDEDMSELLDDIFRKLFDIGVSELSTEEKVLLDQVLADHHL